MPVYTGKKIVDDEAEYKYIFTEKEEEKTHKPETKLGANTNIYYLNILFYLVLH
jgi:hypothetical protein